MPQVPFETTPAPEPAPFAIANFAENPEPRCPCLLLLDRSGSMAGQRIRELNDGLGACRSNGVDTLVTT
jgi:hypothetical protein